MSSALFAILVARRSAGAGARWHRSGPLAGKVVQLLCRRFPEIKLEFRNDAMGHTLQNQTVCDERMLAVRMWSAERVLPIMPLVARMVTALRDGHAMGHALHLALCAALFAATPVQSQGVPGGITELHDAFGLNVGNSNADSAARPAATADQAQPDPNRSRDLRALPQELSPWTMFLSSNNVVKAVMASLVIASFVTWTILFAKSLTLTMARWSLQKAVARISAASMLSEAEPSAEVGHNLVRALLIAATQEIRDSGPDAPAAGIKERVASRFSEICRIEARAVRQGMSVLATIGATAPFVGLFGTVWGIMDSFIGISKSQTTNLAVVAPGIAEACSQQHAVCSRQSPPS